MCVILLKPELGVIKLHLFPSRVMVLVAGELAGTIFP
jgi:hypothetical protein